MSAPSTRRYHEDDDERLDPGAFLIGRQAALADWHFRRDQKDFAKLCQRLLARRWYIANARRVLDERKARTEAAALARRGEVITCKGCRMEFCQVVTEAARPRGQRPEFCSMRCYLASWYAPQSAAKKESRAAQELTCAACGGPITRRPPRGKLPKFCGALCQGRDAKRRREERAAQVAA